MLGTNLRRIDEPRYSHDFGSEISHTGIKTDTLEKGKLNGAGRKSGGRDARIIDLLSWRMSLWCGGASQPRLIMCHVVGIGASYQLLRGMAE